MIAPPRRPALLLLPLILLSACSSPRQLYDGPERPRGEGAVIRVKHPRPSKGAPGDEVYEVRMVGLDDLRFESHETLVAVLPGRHLVHLEFAKYVMPYYTWAGPDSELVFWQVVAEGSKTMEIEVEAGELYSLVVPWDDSGIEWYFQRHVPAMGRGE